LQDTSVSVTVNNNSITNSNKSFKHFAVVPIRLLPIYLQAEQSAMVYAASGGSALAQQLHLQQELIM
jgi:hypothetical protein